jgi:hypothetical protein
MTTPWRLNPWTLGISSSERDKRWLGMVGWMGGLCFGRRCGVCLGRFRRWFVLFLSNCVMVLFGPQTCNILYPMLIGFKFFLEDHMIE